MNGTGPDIQVIRGWSYALGVKKPFVRRGLQLFLTIVGLVMITAGLLVVLFGASLVPREGVVTPDVDTETRLFAVWYAAAGIGLLRAVPRIESGQATVRLVGAAFFVAGCARLLSWFLVGRPHPQFLVLMVIEILLPLVVVPWHASIAKSARLSDDSRGT